ncbi:MAG: bacterial proteasome activator family protein [Ilumatobacter sp.]|nr:bacterial proteasome activator family protein [Ilumatobacter sp.]
MSEIDTSSEDEAPSGTEIVRPDLITDDRDTSDDGEQVEAITQPAKVMRIGSMVKQLLEEVRAAGLDEASRERLAEVYERSVTEVSEALSPDLQEELRSLALPFDHEDVPSEAELRVAKAQLVGWLEGLFHGIQASMMAQQMAMRAQLQGGARELPGAPMQPGGLGDRPDGERPGTYL